MIKRLLEIKKKIKAKNPLFKRQDYHVWKRLTMKYRKGKGMHSKMRHKKKGVLAYVQSGYRTPKAIRNFTKHGLKKVQVSNASDLSKIDPKSEAINIAKVGMKKRIEIVKLAHEKKIKVLNLKDDFLVKSDKTITERKSVKQKKLSIKKSKEDLKKQKSKKEEKGEKETMSDEEKKKKEKEEKDKVLTQKQ